LSGRDVNSWGLGFGTMVQPGSTGTGGEKVFAEVVVAQHCPLVHRDALVNYARHKDKVRCTLLHLQKAEMAEGVADALKAAIARQEQSNVPVVVISSGGRKGLNPSYVRLLKETPAIRCVIYNSCSTKSLERDMTVLLDGPNGFLIDDFRSYDFFGGTGYTSSLLKLTRRPRTLVIPIGPAGVGKSVLASTMCGVNPRKYVRWHRDGVYKSLRDGGISLVKSKQMCHEQLLEFLRGYGNENETENEDGTTDSSSRDGLVRIVDSTNGNRDARELYIQTNQPDLVLLVELRPVGGEDTSNEVLDMLLERTRNRLEGGDACHPSFPTTVEGQRKKHVNILKGIQYPTTGAEVVENNGVVARGVAEKEQQEYGGNCAAASRPRRQTVHLICDPSDSRRLSLLPFKIFLECSTNIRLKEVLGVENGAPIFEVV